MDRQTYRMMHKITVPFPSVLEVPSGFINSFAGFRPTSTVLYTHLGDFVVELHQENGGSGYELRNPAVESLLTNLSMREGQILEFESNSNTDLIIRAYDDLGFEKNCGNSTHTHFHRHFRVQLDLESKSSLAVCSTFRQGIFPTNPDLYALSTNLGTFGVKGIGLGVYGEGGIRFCDELWTKFHRRHSLRSGCHLVFQHTGGCRFNVLFYNSDGSDMEVLSGRPAGFGQQCMSLILDHLAVGLFTY